MVKKKGGLRCNAVMKEKKPLQKYATKSPYNQIQIISKKSIQSCQMAPQKIPFEPN